MSKEPTGPAPYSSQQASPRHFWTVGKTIALVLILLAVTSVGLSGLYFYVIRPGSPISPTSSSCSDGATNPPSCNNNVCGNGATNYPSCSSCPSGRTYSAGSCLSNCSNGAIDPPSCTSFQPCINGANNPPSCNTFNSCTNGALNPPACNQYLPCTNGATNPPSCNDNGDFCMAFNFGEAEYSQNSTGWYITLYIQNFCSDRNLIVSQVSVNDTTVPGSWTLPPGYAPTPPFYSGPPPTHVVVCMSCVGLVFVPCSIYMITVWVTGTGTSAGATTTQTRGYGWQC